jgi:hypothetical protein
MTERANATPDRRAPACGACLSIDETAAVVTAPASLSGELYAHLRAGGVTCSLAQGLGGRDVIDLGDPSPAEERRIRALFAAWRAGDGAGPAEGRDGASGLYVWVALAVVAAWLLSLIAL